MLSVLGKLTIVSWDYLFAYHKNETQWSDMSIKQRLSTLRFFFFHFTSKCDPHSAIIYRGKISWENEYFYETREWFFKISLHDRV